MDSIRHLFLKPFFCCSKLHGSFMVCPSGFQAFHFQTFVFGVCDPSQLARWIESLVSLKEDESEEIPVWQKRECGRFQRSRVELRVLEICCFWKMGFHEWVGFKNWFVFDGSLVCKYCHVTLSIHPAIIFADDVIKTQFHGCRKDMLEYSRDEGQRSWFSLVEVGSRHLEDLTFTNFNCQNNL